MSEFDYTFQLGAGRNTRYNAGPYNEEDRSPRYELEYSPGPDCNSLIKVEYVLMGPEGSRIWVWDIENNSNNSVFITIKKDGQLVKHEE